MDNITYITGNYGKYIATKEKFERAWITIEYFKFEFEEQNINDLELISKEQAK